MKPGRMGLTFWLLALPLSGLLLYFSLRGVEWPRVGQMLSTVSPAWVVFGLSAGAFSILLRAIRWRVLLSAQSDVSLSLVFSSTCAGYFGNSFLPLRAGELIRTFMISAGANLSKSYVLTTGMSERVSDAVALVGISAVVLMSGAFRPDWLGQAARPFATLGICGLLSILVLPRLEPIARKVLDRLPLPEKVKDIAAKIFGQILLGFRSFHDRGRLLRFLGLSTIIWIVDGLGAMIAAHALGLTMSVPAAYLLIAAMGLSSAIPSTPGYVGVYQFVAVTVLVPFGFTRTDAIAYILLMQLMQYVLITILGPIGFWQYQKMRRLATEVDVNLVGNVESVAR